MSFKYLSSRSWFNFDLAPRTLKRSLTQIAFLKLIFALHYYDCGPLKKREI